MFPGRFAFPLFAYMIAWNMAKKDKDVGSKYFLRLIPFTVITVFVERVYYPDVQINILMAFMVSILIIMMFSDIAKIKNKWIRRIAMCAIVIGVLLLNFHVRNVYFGVWVIPAYYMFFKTRSVVWYIVATALTSIITYDLTYAILLLPFTTLLLLTEATPSKTLHSFKKTGWLFYAYYPLHLLVIGLIAGR